MKPISLQGIARAAAILVSGALCTNAFAVDAFDSGSNLLTIDSITTGGVTYRNVAINLKAFDLVGVAGGAPSPDSFNPANNTLLLGSLAFQGVVYNNVTVKVKDYAILNVGGTGTAGTLAASNYNDDKAGYLAALNNYRTECGLPALAQNTRLDTAAYNKLMNQIPAPAAAAGVSYEASASVGGIWSDYRTGSTNFPLVGLYQLQTAMMTPGALLNMMRPYTEIGMYSQFTRTGGDRRSETLILGNPIVRNTVSPITFPCANTTTVPPYGTTLSGDVYYAATAPTANHLYFIEGVTFNQGTPIAVFANPGENLVLTNASVTLRGGAGVPVILKSNHPDMFAYEGFVWPQQNLLPNATYDVTIYGTVNGIAFGKNYSFRTGGAIPLSLQ